LIVIFIIAICFFLIIFLLKFFIYQIWFLFIWLLLILFEIIYEMLIIIILISSSFFFFNFLDLISIILIIIYFIWDNLWNYIFFQFHSHSTFWFVRFVPHYFNKLEKNKTLISYFSAHFPWHNQILENVFQLIFHYTTKHRKILFRNSLSPEFTFQKETTFQQTNGA